MIYLQQKSVLRFVLPIKLRSSIILRELGQLSEDTQEQITQKLCKLLSE